jgi:L-malate glycosyltransferase
MASKIIYLLDSFDGPYGGTETQLWHLVKRLDRNEFAPELVMLRHSDFTRGRVDWPCPASVLSVTRLFSLDGFFKLVGLVRYLRKSDAQILQAFFTEASLIGPLLGWLSGMKYVASRRDLGIWYSPAILRYLRAARGLVDTVIVNSKAVRDLVTGAEKIPAGKIRVIINGLDVTPQAPDLNQDAQRAGLPHHESTLVTGIVANLKRVKRIDVLLRAFVQVRMRVASSRLVIVGEGELEHELKALAAELGIADAVEFTGRVEEPSSLIGGFDIAVLCSQSEGMSNALMEYLRAGKPVVCTNVGGNPELVEHGGNGYLVDVGDVDGLAAAIIRIADDRELYAAMSAQASQSVRQYSLEAMVQQHMDVYRGLVREMKNDRPSYKTA